MQQKRYLATIRLIYSESDSDLVTSDLGVDMIIDTNSQGNCVILSDELLQITKLIKEKNNNDQ